MAPHYAHSLEGQPPDRWELLEDHLRLVAEGNKQFAGAAGFAEVLGAREFGRLLGLWHDLGKYSDAFQERLAAANGVEAHLETQSGRVDHSTAGAKHAVSQLGPLGRLLAFCIAGHHGGLPDTVDTKGGASGLEDRLKKVTPSFDSAPTLLLEQSRPPLPTFCWSDGEADRAFQIAVFCRMLYSCLVDADYLATEYFMDQARAASRPQGQPAPAALLEALEKHIRSLQEGCPNTPVNRRRHDVLQACRTAAINRPGLFSLTVPTGGGKTLSSLAFALDHAVRHGLRRVIYAMPFTSIIEQNADVLRKAIAAAGETVVLEHHSNLDTEREAVGSRLAAENWDAPVIVTTNVQFYESLFANRPSRCRKLHRIAKSVIILDEVQTLPVELLKPSLGILQELCRNYGCTIVLCSATQPAVGLREDFPIGLEGVREIIPNVPGLFTALKRVSIERLGTLSDDELAERILGHEQVLCVVNTRGQAANLFGLLNREKTLPGVFHLSAQMCPQHRTAVLHWIHRKLDQGKPCRVVSTQLVEAGVDVDFPVVYRAMAGVDSIAQAAGRCNREGRRAMGHVFIFETDARPPHYVAQAAQETLEISPGHPDLLHPQAVEEYFRLHYWKRQDQWDREQVMSRFANGGMHLQFREAAERYQLICDAQQPVIVPYGRRGRLLVDELCRMDRPPNRGFDRQVQRFIVGLYGDSYRRLLNNQVTAIYHERFCVLMNSRAYDQDLGLRLDMSGFDPCGLMA